MKTSHLSKLYRPATTLHFLKQMSLEKISADYLETIFVAPFGTCGFMYILCAEASVDIGSFAL